MNPFIRALVASLIDGDLARFSIVNPFLPFFFDLFQCFPLVSGIIFQIKKKVKTEMIIYIQNVKALPTDPMSTGKVCETRNTASHRKKVATDIAVALAFVGNISAMTTKVSGPSDIAKQAIYPSIAIKSR